MNLLDRIILKRNSICISIIMLLGTWVPVGFILAWAVTHFGTISTGWRIYNAAVTGALWGSIVGGAIYTCVERRKIILEFIRDHRTV